MQFHHNGYVSTDPRVKPAAGVGHNPSETLPDKVDVLVAGSGPTGLAVAGTLSAYPNVVTAMIEKAEGRLEIGNADGLAKRSVEMFQAFGFAEKLIDESYIITETTFWHDDPENPGNIVRYDRSNDDPLGLSEFPHICVNQARVADYMIEFMANSPARNRPYYGVELLSLEITDPEAEYPVSVRVNDNGTERTILAKYVVGADGARSRVREAIGSEYSEEVSDHAWGVADVIFNTNFPDRNTKALIQSQHGSVLHIPREGGYQLRSYIDLGDLDGDRSGAIRNTTAEEGVEILNKIMHPYTIDVAEMVRWTVYEVAHRVTNYFDDAAGSSDPNAHPRVFIGGDACHTHSAKGGQGLNYSMADGFNLGWKLGQVISGFSSYKLLKTYHDERHPAARDFVDADYEWQQRVADPAKAGNETVKGFYMRMEEMRAGYGIEYKPSQVVSAKAQQALAPGYPLGRRFKSEEVIRRCDANKVHIGHLHEADGRWRIYVFADNAPEAKSVRVQKWADWMENNPASPIVRTRREGAALNDVFDVKVIYPNKHRDFEITDVPSLFKPIVGTLKVEDWQNVFAAAPDPDFLGSVDKSIFDIAGIAEEGAVVLVRPDMYVADIRSLDDPEGLAEFINGVFDI